MIPGETYPERLEYRQDPGPMYLRYDLALFDIDGTLCDPGTGITDAAAHALAAVGIVETDDQALRRFVGPPLEHTLRDLYALGPAQVTEAVECYRDHYRRHGIGQYEAYPGVGSTLERLRNHGVRLGVVTAKIQEFAERALADTDLMGFFDTIHGRAPDQAVTKTVTLASALTAAAAPPDRTIMIGDREHDIHAALDNGIASIGVLYGYGTRDELTAAGATHIVDGPDAIPPLIVGA